MKYPRTAKVYKKYRPRDLQSCTQYSVPGPLITGLSAEKMGPILNVDLHACGAIAEYCTCSAKRVWLGSQVSAASNLESPHL